MQGTGVPSALHARRENTVVVTSLKEQLPIAAAGNLSAAKTSGVTSPKACA